MKKYVLLILVGVLLAGSVSAALVPCGEPGNPCKLCHLWQLFKNVLDFVLYNVVIPGAVLLFAYAGILVLTAGGSQERVKRGRTVFTNTVVGLVIIFCSWLIIGTIMNTLGGGSQAFNIIGAWNKFPPCP
jgi:hypothetical protein